MATEEFIKRSIVSGKQYEELPARIKASVSLADWKHRSASILPLMTLLVTYQAPQSGKSRNRLKGIIVSGSRTTAHKGGSAGATAWLSLRAQRRSTMRTCSYTTGTISGYLCPLPSVHDSALSRCTCRCSCSKAQHSCCMVIIVLLCCLNGQWHAVVPLPPGRLCVSRAPCHAVPLQLRPALWGHARGEILRPHSQFHCELHFPSQHLNARHLHPHGMIP